ASVDQRLETRKERVERRELKGVLRLREEVRIPVSGLQAHHGDDDEKTDHDTRGGQETPFQQRDGDEQEPGRIRHRRERARLRPPELEEDQRADEKQRNRKDRLLVDAARKERREQQRRPVFQSPPNQDQQHRFEDQRQQRARSDPQHPRVERKPARVAAPLPRLVVRSGPAVLEKIP